MSRLRRDRPAPPVRMVHLGLGNFFRAHQAWYTDQAEDASEWGIAAFTGRKPELAEALSAQDGLYTLVTRAAETDGFASVGSLARAHPAADHAAWLRYVACSDVRVVTLTVTEAGYVRDPGGRLARDRPEVRDDVAALRADPGAPVRTTPARLVAGILARRQAGGGPLTIVPCDNLPDNGAVVAAVVRDLTELVDPSALGWLEEHVTYVTTMVDRITPAPTAEDRRIVAAGAGVEDRAPVVTEPFTEWVLSGRFAAGRPRWEDAGATFVEDVAPFEERKLWLLNGAHSLLAYGGALRGHRTVAEATDDDTCRAWLQQWWAEASRHLALPAADIAAYQAALLDRFANPRMQHRLDQIAADGSQKLPVRILPALRRERADGRLPEAAVRVLAAWVCHLRGPSVKDIRADALVPLARAPLARAVPEVLRAVDPVIAADDAVVAAVLAAADEWRSA